MQILSFKKILGLMGDDVRLSGNVLKYDIILDCLLCFWMYYIAESLGGNCHWFSKLEKCK